MTNILYKDLSYKLGGVLIEARRILGPGHKESVYCNLLEELLAKEKISYKREHNIPIISPISNKNIESYRPDF